METLCVTRHRFHQKNRENIHIDRELENKSSNVDQLLNFLCVHGIHAVNININRCRIICSMLRCDDDYSRFE